MDVDLYMGLFPISFYVEMGINWNTYSKSCNSISLIYKLNTSKHKNVESNIEQVLVATPHKAPTIQPPASHHKNYTS